MRVSALNHSLALGILRGLSEFCGKERTGIGATDLALGSIQPQIHADNDLTEDRKDRRGGVQRAAVEAFGLFGLCDLLLRLLFFRSFAAIPSWHLG
jgi:hypothetical protein